VDQAVGGTSAAAPLWAGLIARINQGHGRPVGFVNPLLYSAGKEAFRDVVAGGNQGCLAGVNWDACTGLGSPRGETLASALPGAVRAAGANTTGTAPHRARQRHDAGENVVAFASTEGRRIRGTPRA